MNNEVACNCLVDVFWSDVLGFALTTLSSLLVVWIVFLASRYKKRQEIKNTIILFLRDNILVNAEAIKNEIPEAKNSINIFYGYNGPPVGMYPTFNAKILDNLPIMEVQKLLKEKLVLYIYVIGRLNNLQNRIPYFILSEFSDVVNDHMDKDFERFKDTFPTYEAHFKGCQSIKHSKRRYREQLDFTDEIIDLLVEESKEILEILS